MELQSSILYEDGKRRNAIALTPFEGWLPLIWHPGYRFDANHWPPTKQDSLAAVQKDLVVLYIMALPCPSQGGKEQEPGRASRRRAQRQCSHQGISQRLPQHQRLANALSSPIFCGHSERQSPWLPSKDFPAGKAGPRAVPCEQGE